MKHILIYNPHGEEYKKVVNKEFVGDYNPKLISWVSNERKAFGILEEKKDIGLVVICSELDDCESILSEWEINNPFTFLNNLMDSKYFIIPRWFLCPDAHLEVLQDVKNCVKYAGWGNLKNWNDLMHKDI